jgi:hypothetical protein
VGKLEIVSVAVTVAIGIEGIGSGLEFIAIGKTVTVVIAIAMGGFKIAEVPPLPGIPELVAVAIGENGDGDGIRGGDCAVNIDCAVKDWKGTSTLRDSEWPERNRKGRDSIREGRERL